MAKRKGAKRKRRTNPLAYLSQILQAEVMGIFLLTLALLTLLSLASFSRGRITEAWIHLLRLGFGMGAYLVPFGLGAIGLWLVLKGMERQPRVAPDRVAGIALLFLLFLTVIHLPSPHPRILAAQGQGGGYLGWLVSHALVSGLGRLGSYLVISALMGTALTLVLGVSALEIIHLLQKEWQWLTASLQRLGAGWRRSLNRLRPPLPKAKPSPPPVRVRIIGGEKGWLLPSITEILEESPEREISQAEIRKRIEIIEETLASFGVPGRVVEVNQGPVVTQFGVEPGYIERRDGKRIKVKVSKIQALADDLALALAAAPIRVEAPVPGKSIVGIEVPNTKPSLVALREVMESEVFQRLDSKLKIALGRDVSGHPVAADLATMPHLLIAGTTGSGKSVCINSITTCLLCNNTPDELKLLMVDPKMVELTVYNGLPHLLAPVVVDVEQALRMLHWVISEMDGRYRKFASVRARDIEEYNQHSASRAEEQLPYIVVIIDELADLMAAAPEEMEGAICRIAQMARATGIHLIIATQRPSVDVVTGLIKANFPARISFATASQVDSRVILDMTGAEKLLGRGDMLYLAPDTSYPVRLRGCFVSEREIERLVRYWKSAAWELELGSTVQRPLWADVEGTGGKGGSYSGGLRCRGPMISSSR